MGAEVIKVEAPGKPDPLRDWGQARYEGRTLWWPVQARNKKCITLNLRDPKGQELLLELVRVADVVTENFRPGTLERWNLGYERLSAANPGIVLARISGYGQTGPYAERAGYASVAEAMGGLRYINGFPGEAPPRAGISLGDSLAAMFAVQGILAALYHRDVLGDGRGQVVDVSLMEASFALLESAVPEYDRLGIVRQPHGHEPEGHRAVEHLQVARRPLDGHRREPGRRLPPAVRGDRPSRARRRPALRDASRRAARTRRRSRASSPSGRRSTTPREIDRILNEAGVVCGPIYTMAEIFEDPQYEAREMLVEHVDPEFGPYIGPGIVPKFSETPGEVRWSGTWEEGSHNEEIYCGLLGLTDVGARRIEGGWRRMSA